MNMMIRKRYMMNSSDDAFVDIGIGSDGVGLRMRKRAMRSKIRRGLHRRILNHLHQARIHPYLSSSVLQTHYPSLHTHIHIHFYTASPLADSLQDSSTRPEGKADNQDHASFRKSRRRLSQGKVIEHLSTTRRVCQIVKRQMRTVIQTMKWMTGDTMDGGGAVNPHDGVQDCECARASSPCTTSSTSTGTVERAIDEGKGLRRSTGYIRTHMVGVLVRACDGMRTSKAESESS